MGSVGIHFGSSVLFHKNLWFPQDSLDAVVLKGAVWSLEVLCGLAGGLEFLNSKLCLGLSPTNHRMLSLEKNVLIVQFCPKGHLFLWHSKHISENRVLGVPTGLL